LSREQGVGRLLARSTSADARLTRPKWI
jgi:hypothetical protein